MVIRKLTSKDVPKLKELSYYCFFMGEDPPPKDEWNHYYETQNFDFCWGYFEGEELVSTWLVNTWNIFIRGKPLKVGAVADVTTLPQYRRRGNVAKLFQKSLEQLREAGYVLSVLYPFKYSYYQKFGYEICDERIRVKADPREIVLPSKFTPLTIREIPKKNSLRIIAPVRDAFGKRYSFVKISDEQVWQVRRFRKNDRLFVVEKEDKIVGYFISRIKKLPDGMWSSALDFNEVVSLTDEAFFTVLWYIKQHTDQTSKFILDWPPGELLVDFFSELVEVEIKTQGQSMFRVVDVKQALEQLSFPDTISKGFTFKVLDKTASWNNGTFKLVIKDGRAVVHETDEKEVDLELDIKVFTQLYVGYRSIDELVRLSKAEIQSELIPLIKELFPKRLLRLCMFF